MSDTPQVALFTNAQQVHLEGSTIAVQTHSYTSYHEGTKGGGFKAWKEVTAPAAFHNSGKHHEPPKCHPGTREAILKKIRSWVKGEIDTETFVFWLNGTVGVGKSVIGQTIAETCEMERLLLASFFFARSDDTRNNTKLLITTLAYQIALAIPPVRSFIEQVFENDPLIETRSLDTQAVKLLIDPLEHAIAAHIYIPPLIVVDGLDECLTASDQCRVLDVISHVGRIVNATSRHLVFLISSRPEQEISLKFNSRTLEEVSTAYSMDPKSEDSSSDILHFLEDGFNEIKNTHPLKSSIPASWPTRRDFNILLRRTDGQFLYATLALSYTSSIRHRPTDRLATVLLAGAEAEDNPFTALDTLYHHIFSTIDDVESLLTILGLKMTSCPFITVNLMSSIVDDRLGKAFEDVALLFGDLPSVVNVNVDDDEYGSWRLEFRHASLGEFLKSQKRSRQYHIKTESYHTEWAIWLLNQTPGVQLTGEDHLLSLRHHFKQLMPSQELHAALQARDLIDLYPRHVWQGARGINRHSISRMCSIIFNIRDMVFDDAESLYQSQLKGFKRHITSLLGSCDTRPLTTFTVDLLLSPSALCQLEVVHPGHPLANPALNCVFQSSAGYIRYSSSTEALYSFLSTLIQDSNAECRTPLHGAVDSIRAAAGPVLLLYLSWPSKLPFTPPLKRFLERLKTRPWISLRRSSIRKKFRTWCKLYKSCHWCPQRRSNCIHDHPGLMFRVWAYLPSSLSLSSPHVTTLHENSRVLAYFYALVLLPEVLSKAPRSEELIETCKAHIFHRTCILFPRGTKAAGAAISKYLERMEAEERRWKELWLD